MTNANMKKKFMSVYVLHRIQALITKKLDLDSTLTSNINTSIEYKFFSHKEFS